LAVYDLDRCTVLLVEDNRYVRNVVENLLRAFRVGNVTTAANGQEAVEALKASRPMEERRSRLPNAGYRDLRPSDGACQWHAAIALVEGGPRIP
jgi:CheY-like chemotaxis protein